MERYPNPQQPDAAGNPDLDALNADLDNLAASFPDGSSTPDVDANAAPEADADADPAAADANPIDLDPMDPAYPAPDDADTTPPDANPTPNAAPAPIWPDRDDDPPMPAAPEADPPQVDPAAAAAAGAGAAAVGASVTAPAGGRRGWNFLDNVVGRRGQRRGRSTGSPAETPADPDASTPEPTPAPAPATPNQAGNNENEGDSTPATPARRGGLFGGVVGRRGQRRGRNAVDPAAAPNVDPAANPDDDPADPANPTPTPTPPANPRPATPPAAPHNPATPPAAPAPAAPNRLTKARSLLTPAGMASWLTVKSQIVTGGLKDRLQIEQENPKAMKVINAIGAVAVVGRVAYGIYAGYKGFGTGQTNTEAMQMIGENLQSGQTGSFTDAAMDNAAPRMERVAYEIPHTESFEAKSSMAPIDPSDIAPKPVELGEWKSEESDEGTVWGTTMDYLEEMGVDTDDMSDTEKYKVVDDMLEANNVGGEDATEAERWKAAERLSDDFKVKLPSANGMEDILDAHGVDHDELEPTVDAPASGDDKLGPATGSDGNEGTSQSGNGEQPGAAPTTEPAPAPSNDPSTSEPTPKPSDSTPPAPGPHVAETSGNWGAVGHEVLDTIWQAGAAYTAAGVTGGLGLATMEATEKPAAKPRRRPARRPGNPRPRSRNS